MNSKERVQAVLEGGVPDRVPFAPNIGQWFSYHKHSGTLPPELEGCEDELDAMLRMETDIFSRRLGPFFAQSIPGVEMHRYYVPMDGGPRAEVKPPASTPFGHEEPYPPNVWVVTEVVTPLGTLRNRARFTSASFTTFEEEHFVKDFERDYPALRYIVENTSYAFDPEKYRQVEERLGDQGVAFVPMAQSPIKLLHIWGGQVDGTLFLVDYEKECRDLFEIHTANVVDMAQQAAQCDALAFSLGDNLDSLFYSPPLFRTYEIEFHQEIADILHGADKLLFSHACGRLWSLRELIAEAGLDGMEGIPHPPLGDLPLDEAKNIHDGFIVNGGMTAHEQEITDDPERGIRAYVRDLFDGMRPFDRFFNSSGCNTSIRTPWENLLIFEEACHEFGSS